MAHQQSDDLVRAIHDPNVVLYKDEFVCIIADAYPKSKHHYLVLPLEDIHNLHDLKEHHIPKLIYMELKGLEFVMRATGISHKSLHVGYHAFPSMDRLHLHVLSDDFSGEHMMKPYQWNSFHTEFFVPTHKIISELQTNGCISLPPNKLCLQQPLLCYVCGYKSLAIQNIKLHIALKHST